jgi:enoyl-CoA hydratase
MSAVLLEMRDRVAVVTLNDPDRRNALNHEIVREIGEIFDRLESDDGVGAVVVTGAAPAFCAGADLGNLAEATAEGLKAIYEGFLRVGRSHAAHRGRGQRRRRGGGHEPGAGVRPAPRRPAGQVRHPLRRPGPAPGRRSHLDAAQRRRAHNAKAMVLFGQILDGEAAERAGLVWRCVDDDALIDAAVEVAARAASGPKELVAEVKRTIGDMAAITVHDEAVERELTPQLWSVKQPFFAERLAAIQARISKKQ